MYKKLWQNFKFINYSEFFTYNNFKNLHEYVVAILQSDPFVKQKSYVFEGNKLYFTF